MWNLDGPETRMFDSAELIRRDEIRKSAQLEYDERYDTGREDGWNRLWQQISRRIVDGGHPENCPCTPCDILYAAANRKEAFSITDNGSIYEASRVRRLQWIFNKPKVPRMWEPNGHGLRSFSLGDLIRRDEIRKSAQLEYDERYDTGLEDGWNRLWQEISRRIVDGGHPEDCPCIPCDILYTATNGRKAFYITDDGPTYEASRVRSRQWSLYKYEDRKPELGKGRDPNCIRCHGEAAACFLDTTNWRLCPHAI